MGSPHYTIFQLKHLDRRATARDDALIIYVDRCHQKPYIQDMKRIAKKKGPGRPPAGGPRVQTRYRTQGQVDLIKQAVEKLNAESDDGTETSFNAFVVNAAVKDARRQLGVAAKSSTKRK